MRTLRQAASLLSAPTPDGLAAIAATLGFEHAPQPLDAPTRAALGLPPELRDTRLVRGRGALRALLVSAPSETPLRTLCTSLATGLSSRTSHVLWTLIAASTDGDEIGIACWTAERRPPRVLALLVRPSHVVASDAETLCALEASSSGDDLLVHTRWCELLGRDALSRRFYRMLELRVGTLARSLPAMPDDDRAELALIATSRLLFLSFLQAKGWLDGDRAFLSNRFDECMAGAGGFHRVVMLPLFFGTLNTPMRRRAATARRFGQIPFLNGGLFAKTAVERRHSRARLTDEAIGALFADLLGAFRFTAREDHAQSSEVAIDPEMLGRAFESLMAARERRVSGAYYTPQHLVAHVSDHALACALEGGALSPAVIADALAGRFVSCDVNVELIARLRSLTVLDPACGSGAFLVHLLERITTLRRAVGDARGIAEIRREVLTHTIHGVDVNPMAVWLCELRLWLSVVIESDETRMAAVMPLPNLECQVRVGDTLAGEAFGASPGVMGPPASLLRLRQRYARASGARKAPLRRAITRDERTRALVVLDRQLSAVTGARRELVLARRSPDLFGVRASCTRDDAEQRRLRDEAAALRRERRRIADGGALPFSFPSHFAHIHEQGGFRLVIGNPPWVRLHNIAPASRAALRTAFRVFREPGWRVSLAEATPSSFAPQVDLAALFVERSVALAAPGAATRVGGTVALLLPAKLWRSLSGGAVRRLLATDTSVRRVEDWTDAPSSFDAAVYPSVLVASRHPARVCETVLAVRRRSLELEWSVARDMMHFDGSDRASPWLLLPPDARLAFDRIRERGRALGASALGRATLGVKCGCNEAYMVNSIGVEQGLISVEYRGRTGTLEPSILRPLLRGESVAAWRVPASNRAIVWTHGASGSPLTSLPTGAARWLAPWRRRLRARTDLRGSNPWWMLFRTESADASVTRVVWSDFGRVPRAAILAAGDPTVPLNSCYVVACADVIDALSLTALLNSPVAAAWLNALAEPARGGWHRYLAWTVALLPLPHDWSRAREILAPLAERALLGDLPTDEELLLAACHAYRLQRDVVAPLVAWCR
ncbi:MAG: hypothetical protein LH467_14730 [Gemmatimonadaceae bacterium]|nr:hypothetical protein [Gemmatimonadaceae bacterium]